MSGWFESITTGVTWSIVAVPGGGTSSACAEKAVEQTTADAIAPAASNNLRERMSAPFWRGPVPSARGSLQESVRFLRLFANSYRGGYIVFAIARAGVGRMTAVWGCRLGRDCGPGASEHGFRCLVQRCDDGTLPATDDEVAARLDLRSHRPLRELSELEQAARFAQRETFDRLRLRRTEMNFHSRDGGQDEQGVGANESCQQRRGAILVDHGFDAAQCVAHLDDGHAAPSGRNDDVTG